MTNVPTRRRFIGISAAAAGLALLPIGTALAQPADGEVVVWRGTALGAVATLRIHHRNRCAAERLAAHAVAEVRRLEALFSLYRDDSALAALNRRGVLEAPPPELVALIEACRRFHTLTAGAFDPTVQPLWELYIRHFAQETAAPDGPPADRLAETLHRVGLQHVMADRNRIAFARPGMALTLNGIAQGWITDRVVTLLRAGGIASSLVDMGEARAFGQRPDGTAWRAGIADPHAAGQLIETVALDDCAVATSGGYGLRFDAAGRFDHLIDPRTGRSPRRYDSLSVVAPDATTADALSTGFSCLGAAEIRRIRQEAGATTVLATSGAETLRL
ncbi:FAD:protein FMN transferase [Chelatococcus daeguensis]|uniref:FAD:protein FMN transferase n=1 Tax=Chelatococcus daeguensis TaxID=444444 RepID=UPI0007AC066C|nr:FAD:protein FMN transferase [Chelatococcus daeguensis]KZE28919.1 thiamine biosynthesis protein ApbE [Chelatococcus daeguensis]MBM3083603.1 FAD:protein FMN transferase [Chelatococcus daeguensis]